MDEKLRDSLMEWYLRFGEREVTWNYMYHHSGAYETLREAYCSILTTATGMSMKKISPEGLAYLKEKQYNGNPTNENRSGIDE